MLREHARTWGALDSLERATDAGAGTGLALGKRLTVQLLHHGQKESPGPRSRPWHHRRWNVIAVRPQITGSYETTPVVKLIVAVVPGVTAALHARARSAAGLEVLGSLTGTSTLAALFPGILLAG
jgi:hypothetical protein